MSTKKNLQDWNVHYFIFNQIEIISCKLTVQQRCMIACMILVHVSLFILAFFSLCFKKMVSTMLVLIYFIKLGQGKMSEHMLLAHTIVFLEIVFKVGILFYYIMKLAMHK